MRPTPFGEVEFLYLNRSARPEIGRIRETLERWFAHFPAHAQRDLSSRLKSKDRRQRVAAFFELHCHELFAAQGYELEPHPPALRGERRPDFLVLRQGRRVSYLECLIAAESDYESSGWQLD